MNTTSTPGTDLPASGRPAEGARIIAITSGKGGVGKTLLMDVDLGLANLDVVLNLQPRRTLHDVFTGRATLDQAVLDAPGDFQVLLAGSGLIEYSRLTPEVREQFARLLDTVRPRYDRILLDTGAGISDVVLYAISLADDALVIATPEPTSLADAYATVKVLGLQQGRASMLLVVNQIQRPGEGRQIATQLQSVIERFVQLPDGGRIRLQPLGEIPTDASVRQAVQRRQLVMTTFPGSDVATGIGAHAPRLAAPQPPGARVPAPAVVALPPDLAPAPEPVRDDDAPAAVPSGAADTA